MHYFLHFGFDGTNYRGWQRQPVVKSVQQTIEEALKKVLKVPIILYGCGRTDAGVHASQYIAHIEVEKAWTEESNAYLNYHLPDDIVLFESRPLENFHARYHAVQRSYTYFIHKNSSPLLNHYSSYYPYKTLDAEAMLGAVDFLRNTSDFRALCKQPEKHNHTRCEIFDIDLRFTKDQERIMLSITANRFLRGMIRILVFHLYLIGTKKQTVAFFKDYVNAKVPLENRPAHPQGLFLSKVAYSFGASANQSPLFNLMVKEFYG